MTSQQLYAEDPSPTSIQFNNGEVLHEALSGDGNQSPENSSSTLTAASPLGVIFNAAGQDRVLPGSRFTLSVTISNKGLQSAVIDVWIEPLAEDLRRWYPPARERLALGTGQSNEVLFQFQLPVNTLPGSYSYLVVVDAQEHYLELEDIQQHPLPIDTLPGALLWEPRPWWHFLPFLALGLLGLLAIAYLIWWAFFRVPPPLKIVEFFPEDSLYHAENGDTVRLGWQISEPQHLQSLKIAGVSKEGTPLTRPDIYDLSQGIPTPLQPFCTQTDRQLNCRNFPTSARKAGTYQFEMTLQTNKKQDTTLLTRKTGPVEIKPIPLPAIVTFGSAQPTYQESRPLMLKPRKPLLPNRQSQPQDGIHLNWKITHPDRLQELQLLGRNPEGVVVSPVQRYDLSQGIPPELLSACKVAEQLVCKNVTTNADRPGDYMFELSAIPKRNLGTAIATKKSTLIKVLPKPSQIVLFDINGRPAKPSYLIPIVPAPKKMPRLLLSWQVDAGKGAKVALSPFPGNIPLQGNIPIVLSPKPSTSTITLQVTSAMGEPITRAVTIETYDPKTTDPEKVATAAAKAAAAEIGKAQQQAAAQQAKPGGQQPPFQIPSSTPPPPLTPDSLTPLEIPPQLDLH
jgi:hypothetical protein